MTYDPYRNEPPRDPYRDSRDIESGGSGATILLGALLLAAIGGFIYFYAMPGDQSVATNDMRPPITQPSTTGSAPAPETTGSSANMPPAATPKLEPRVKPVE
ncbi:hypothetical protein [Pseudorhodoplanes sp.]|uniref:hypothetical protein n=1 Tax=Pseudorhodoplanes sp. TaxID=1934341 RepID=UPI002C640B72|nr:hypothetical protein [Pseudorhodoplanes sp.]HWV52271.1 hypothetical protein [Pseudorhodoplanes sp.]